MRCNVCILVSVFCIIIVLHFLFFKQTTAYELRISDWSSDVYSSVLWISLQYGDCAEDLAALRGAGIAIHDDPAIDSFRDLDGFAAQIAALDEVVTVSNTTVHVAGGLAVSCRLLLPAGRGRLWY